MKYLVQLYFFCQISLPWDNFRFGLIFVVQGSSTGVPSFLYGSLHRGGWLPRASSLHSHRKVICIYFCIESKDKAMQCEKWHTIWLCNDMHLYARVKTILWTGGSASISLNNYCILSQFNNMYVCSVLTIIGTGGNTSEALITWSSQWTTFY